MTDTPSSPSRRRHVGLWVSLSTVLLLVLIGTVVQLVASQSFDQAERQFLRARGETASVLVELQRDEASSRTLWEESRRLREGDEGFLSTPEAREQMDAALEEAAAALDEAADVASTPLPEGIEKPIWPWQLFAESVALTERTADAHVQSESLRSVHSALAPAITALQDSTTSLVEDAIESAADIESNHLSALNDTIIDLRQSLASLRAQLARGAEIPAEEYAQLHTAASAVISSHEEVLASKEGRLLQRRLDVEEYARSIAGGVLLDFEWQRIVNGRGEGGSAGGLATWYASHGGYATITLSNSVAERWPSDVMRALVTHEVGHAISAKCYEMFDWQDPDANEEWATAWAISMGHHADGNGVSLYGYPRQEIIDKAASCR